MNCCRSGARAPSLRSRHDDAPESTGPGGGAQNAVVLVVLEIGRALIVRQTRRSRKVGPLRGRRNRRRTEMRGPLISGVESGRVQRGTSRSAFGLPSDALPRWGFARFVSQLGLVVKDGRRSPGSVLTTLTIPSSRSADRRGRRCQTLRLTLGRVPHLHLRAGSPMHPSRSALSAVRRRGAGS
jgi:hypothetical protein